MKRRSEKSISACPLGRRPKEERFEKVKVDMADQGKARARKGGSAEARRRAELDYLLSTTFDTILRIEERSLDNKLTEGLTITEVHTIVAVGLHEENPMNVVAARLGVTLATLTTAVNKLVKKGFIGRGRSEEDRRKVLVRLTNSGRKVYRAHNLFHQRMINEALEGLSENEEVILANALAKVRHFFEEMSGD